MSSRRPSPSPHKRIIALKRADGEPLTRGDIQYDVLFNVFHDTNNVFTDPYPPKEAPAPKITFRELYLKTIMHSPKATKALKDKMSDSQLFGEDFAMLALLVNVGRVNTTMSFFPEMKTAIRTYHPIPALQRTSGNLQDAPRIKHILKASFLEKDSGNTPTTPADILSRVTSGQVPSTTVMNLIFVLANHSAVSRHSTLDYTSIPELRFLQPIGHLHFADNIDFIDIFLRENVSSLSRARAFLWLCYHYLESPAAGSDDDYDDDSPTNPFGDSRRGNTPTFVFLSNTEIAQENVDPEDEKELAEKLVTQRAEILRTQGAKEMMKQSKASAGSVIGGEEEEPIQNSEEVKVKGKRGAGKAKSSTAKEKKAASAALRRARMKEEKAKEPETLTPHENDDDFEMLGSLQAWHIVTTTDPLLDSDEEGADEHLRHDYIRRLKIINTLRCKEPTPEPEQHFQDRFPV
ncbi:hypothetical protein DXG03_006086 [Asterophora parasitica]|uniref:Ino eighty subunit 1 n=1 Tax=Asterophora parasitica TaxID=117018 RepID=A0A9P7GJH7_9AGAR|nr:hypothetical protein DXG03_006086 [Asterophora parasitica]